MPPKIIRLVFVLMDFPWPGYFAYETCVISKYKMAAHKWDVPSLNLLTPVHPKSIKNKQRRKRKYHLFVIILSWYERGVTTFQSVAGVHLSSITCDYYEYGICRNFPNPLASGFPTASVVVHWTRTAKASGNLHFCFFLGVNLCTTDNGPTNQSEIVTRRGLSATAAPVNSGNKR